ncbi:MAG: hypothetical protein HWE07_06415 [Cytophagia bacterium]|nr:hypothetical protein [Cytophagia bacterium]
MIDVTNEYGIILRKNRITELGITREKLLEIMEVSAPLDESKCLISFGPHFGGEASDEFVKRLQSLGLVFFDDFFVMSGDFPTWAKFHVDIESGYK